MAPLERTIYAALSSLKGQDKNGWLDRDLIAQGIPEVLASGNIIEVLFFVLNFTITSAIIKNACFSSVGRCKF